MMLFIKWLVFLCFTILLGLFMVSDKKRMMAEASSTHVISMPVTRTVEILIAIVSHVALSTNGLLKGCAQDLLLNMFEPSYTTGPAGASFFLVFSKSIGNCWAQGSGHDLQELYPRDRRGFAPLWHGCGQTSTTSGTAVCDGHQFDNS